MRPRNRTDAAAPRTRRRCRDAAGARAAVRRRARPRAPRPRAAARAASPGCRRGSSRPARRSLPSRASRCCRSSSPPGRTAVAAARRIERCIAGSTARSLTLSRQRASGCRRKVPVPVQGTSIEHARPCRVTAGKRASPTNGHDVARVEPAHVLAHARQPRERRVAGEHDARRARQLERLAARRGAQVGDPRAGRERRVARDERGRGILQVEEPLLERAELRHRADAAGEHEAVAARAAHRRR